MSIKINQNEPNRELNLEYQPIFTLPLINEPAPPFKANSTLGTIDFPNDYKGKWVFLFSYPGDFCATCTTEMLELAKNKDLYDELGVEIIALSTDTIFSHLEWMKEMYKLDYNGYKNTEIEFPIIADTTREVSRKYGLLRRGEENTETVRGGFLINPEGRIRAIQIYPSEVGANGAELRRIMEATIKADTEGVYTPANWTPGEPVLIPKPETFDEVKDTFSKTDPNADIFCPDWFLCYKKDTAFMPTNNINTQRAYEKNYSKVPLSYKNKRS